MRSSQEDIAILDLYVKGRLDYSESKELESRLLVDSDLKADLDDLKVLQQGMRVNALKDKFEMMKGWESEGISSQKSKSKWWKWPLLIFILSIMGYLLYNYTFMEEDNVPEEYEKLYAEAFKDNFILHKTTRALVQSDRLSAEQRRAYEMYSIQLFDDAIPLLEDLWKINKDTLALFYLGVSQVGDGKKEKGLNTLQKPELKKYSNQTKLFINH